MAAAGSGGHRRPKRQRANAQQLPEPVPCALCAGFNWFLILVVVIVSLLILVSMRSLGSTAFTNPATFPQNAHAHQTDMLFSGLAVPGSAGVLHLHHCGVPAP